MLKVAAYCRVSTEEQAKNFSITNQLDYLRKYCQERGYQIYHEYVDAGWSGTILDRPALTQLMQDARARKFDMVVVYKLDRLFRNNRHMFNTLDEWEKLDIAIASATEPFDTSTAMGQAYVGMASTFAEWERNTFMERSRAGMIKAVEQGHYSGGVVAYGYRYNPKIKTLEIAEEEAQVIRDIYRWLIEENMTSYSIAKRLNALGIPTRYALDGRRVKNKATACLWRSSDVCKMIRNSTYKGIWQYGKRGKNAEHIMQTQCPAVIDAPTYDRAQSRLKENNRWADRHSHRCYLLRGLIRCGDCGHSYTGCHRVSSHLDVRYYRCNCAQQQSKLLAITCNSPTIKADVIEDLIWQQIGEFIQNRATVKKAFQDKYNVCQQANYVAELAQCEKRLNELTIAEQRLWVKYADPVTNFTEEALQGALTEIKNSMALIRTRIGQLKAIITTEEEQIHRLDEIDQVLDLLKDKITNASLETKCRIFQLLVKEVRVSMTDGVPLVTIVYWFDKKAVITQPDVQLHSTRDTVSLFIIYPQHRILNAMLPARHGRQPQLNLQENKALLSEIALSDAL